MRSRWPLLMLTLVTAAGTLYPALRPTHPLLVYNPSLSVPRGWYAIQQNAHYQAGGIVLVQLPAEAGQLAAQRSYLPAKVPLLKRVAAVAPQSVCIRGGRVHIDGAQVAAIRDVDAQRRPLPEITFCGTLGAQQLFVMSADSLDSFDGRYFGPIERRQVIGVAHPVWLP
jgi:conjugative transfer signal peptidase TraF